jgi:hypothetical protein
MAVDTYPDLFWGTSVIWGVLVVYLIILGRKVSKLERLSKRD